MPIKIAVFGQAYKTQSLGYIVHLISLLTEKSCEILVFDKVLNLVKDEVKETVSTYGSNKTLPNDIDYMISVGGDGTMLAASTYVKDKNISIIGINTGRLGFLATIQKEEINTAIDELLAGRYSIIKRSLLEVNIGTESKETYFALNEITVSRKNTTTMITIDTFINEEYLNTYWADGLIVATPTGSTGYSLSCNGPIIAPEVAAFAITPIAPHNLSIRPLIIKDNTNIKLEISSREKDFLLSMDSKVVSVKIGTAIYVKKADFSLQMIELNNQSFLKTLREKLLWGKDTRN